MGECICFKEVQVFLMAIKMNVSQENREWLERGIKGNREKGKNFGGCINMLDCHMASKEVLV